jgi:hypothetical protein
MNDCRNVPWYMSKTPPPTPSCCAVQKQQSGGGQKQCRRPQRLPPANSHPSQVITKATQTKSPGYHETADCPVCKPPAPKSPNADKEPGKLVLYTSVDEKVEIIITKTGRRHDMPLPQELLQICAWKQNRWRRREDGKLSELGASSSPAFVWAVGPLR